MRAAEKRGLVGIVSKRRESPQDSYLTRRSLRMQRANSA
jgi:hypothetical protein